MKSTRKRVRKVATNLSIRADLVKRARAANVNLSSVMEAALEAELRVKEREVWLAENAEDPDASDIRVRHQQYKWNYLRHRREHLGWAIFVGWKRP